MLRKVFLLIGLIMLGIGASVCLLTRPPPAPPKIVDRSRLVVKLPVPRTSRLSIDGWTSDRRWLIVSAQARLPNGGGGNWQTWLLEARTNTLKRAYEGGEHPIPNPAWKDRLLFTTGATLRWFGLDGRIEPPFYYAPQGQRINDVVLSKRGDVAFYLIAGRYPNETATIGFVAAGTKRARVLVPAGRAGPWYLRSPGGGIAWSPDGTRLAFHEFSRTTSPRRMTTARLALLDPASGRTEHIESKDPLIQPRAPWRRWTRQRRHIGIVRQVEAHEEFVEISTATWEPRQVPRGGRPSPDQRMYLVFIEDNPDALASPPVPWWRRQLQGLLRVTPPVVKTTTVGTQAAKLAYASSARLSWDEAFYETSHLWLLTDEGGRKSLVRKYQNPTWSSDSKRVFFTRPGEVRVVTAH